MKKALLAILVVSVLLIPAFNAGNPSVEKKDGFVKLGGMDGTSFSRGIFNVMNGRQTILQFILSSIFTNFKDRFISDITPETQSTTGGVDQSQEDYSGGYVEIYGNRWYAQSFVHQKYGKITGIDIMVEKHTRNLGLLKTKGNNLLDNIGSLYLSIRDSLNGSDLASTFISSDDIPKATVWINFDIRDIQIEWGKEYYIVVHQLGGDERNYYKWYYGSGDCYSAGDGYSKEGSEWKNFGNDFAFRTYGEYTGDEPDGTVSKYAVVVGTRDDPNGKEIYTDESARAMGDVLSKNGWSVNLLIDISAADARNALLNMREEEDKDDMVLFYFSGHGGYIDLDNDGIPDEYGIIFMGGVLTTSDLNNIFDGFASDKIVIIIESCFSGGFISNDKINLKQEGRIIITSSKASEVTWASHSLRSGVFNHFFVEGLKGSADRDKDVGNQDGIVTAEESFNYAQPRTTAWVKKDDKVTQTPQMYDGIPGDVPLTTYGGNSSICNLQNDDILYENDTGIALYRKM